MDNYSTVLITCGDLCACSRIEPCDNHISKLNRGHRFVFSHYRIKAESCRFEYFRTDKKKGFGLRTLNPIQMGRWLTIRSLTLFLDQVVVEFVGCVKPVGSIKTQSSLDYSFEQSSDDLVYLLDLIQKNTKVYSDVSRALSYCTSFIAPTLCLAVRLCHHINEDETLDSEPTLTLNHLTTDRTSWKREMNENVTGKHGQETR